VKCVVRINGAMWRGEGKYRMGGHSLSLEVERKARFERDLLVRCS